jgi:beta-glucosidase
LRTNGNVTVSVAVTNTGTRAGDEVVQLYARHVRSSVPRPNRDLRGYQRITLLPGATQTLSFTVDAKSLAWWNAQTKDWVVEASPVEFEVGASSADIRLRQTVTVTR